MLSRNNLNDIMENLSSYGDILAIPFFLLLTIYFYNIERRSATENILLLFFYRRITSRYFIHNTFLYLIEFKKLSIIRARSLTRLT